MPLTFECPQCHHNFNVDSNKLKKHQGNESLGYDTPPPDIQTAYQNVGKTITELYGFNNDPAEK
ncbi:MAG: hypothetical protein H6Q74_1763 [Firmicutes bacterium]|nr:hypothetical protein [Bacillota bacterium]